MDSVAVALWLACLLLLPLRASAVETAPGPGIGFAAALELAERSPLLRETAAGLASKRALDRQVSTLTVNPQAAVQLGYRRVSDAERGVDVQVSLQQGFNLAGYAAARAASMQREESAQEAELRALRLGRRLAVARAWLTLWGAEEALAAARVEQQAMTELLERVERAARAMALTRTDVAEARAYLGEARLAALNIEGEVFELGLELGRLVGQAGVEAGQLVAAGGPPEIALPEVTPELLAQLLRRVESLPGSQLRRLQADAERAHDAEAQAARGTQLNVGVLGLHEPATPYALMGTLSVTLPLFERGQRERAEILGRLGRLQGEAQEALLAQRAELLFAVHDVQHSHEQWEQLQLQVVPASSETLALRERLLGASDGTVLEVILARRAAAAARGRLGRSLAAHSFARYRLWLYLQALGLAAGDESPPTGRQP